MNKLKKLIIYILNIPLYWISCCIPKNKNLWIFGAWFGEKYADNSKYLFEYVNRNHSHIRAVWLSKNKKTVELIKSKGYEVYYTYDIRAILLALKARFSIFVHSNRSDNLMFLNNKNTKLIQLWHGSPLKKIGLDDNIFSNKKKQSLLKQMLFPFIYEHYDIIIAQSENDRNIFKSAFNNKNIIVTGYPRNDSFFNKKKSYSTKSEILYVPTFRDNIGSEIDLFTDYNFDINKWQKYLEKNKIVFNIKMHPVNKTSKTILDKLSKSKNIIFLDEIDINDILPSFDILINDYSSIYFDFLLTNKPIVFAPFDYVKYLTKDRELYYDYDEVTPGPKCKDWNEVLKWIEKFNFNSSLYAKEREIIRNRFHKYLDGNSCMRVFEQIVKLNEEVGNQ